MHSAFVRGVVVGLLGAGETPEASALLLTS